jgi:hypothetical protein
MSDDLEINFDFDDSSSSTEKGETTQEIKCDGPMGWGIVPVPANNEGRTKCFWCGKDTVKKPSFIMTIDYCEDCKK